MASEKSRSNPKFIPIFSHQAAPILSQSLQLAVPGPAKRDVMMSSATTSELETTGTPQAPSLEPQCLSCHAFFSSREEQVAHYRLDWHRYNLKRKLSGEPPVGQEEFEKIAGDLSSISGSESDSDDPASRGASAAISEDTPPAPQPAGSPFLHFVTPDDTTYAVYRYILSGPKPSVSDGMLLDLLSQLLQQSQVWIILMKAGGHFAGAVFRDSRLLAHKTFHRYTVRAQRGTVQSARDSNQGAHKPKSAGASLRRYNEAALEQEIHELISSWSEYVEQASAIFIRVPKYSKSTFVGGKKSPFSRDDSRLRSIPFSTRRPTLKEVRVVHSKLAALYVQKSHDSMQGSHDYTKSHDSWLQTQDSPSTCSTWLLDSHGETTEKLQSDSDCAQTEACELLREAAPDGDTAAMESVEQSKNGSEGGSEGDGQGRDGSEGDGQGRDGSEGDGQGRDGSEGDSQGRNKKKKRRGDKQKTEQVAMEPVPATPAIPTEAQHLLRLCREGGEEALVELLQSQDLQPLYDVPDRDNEANALDSSLETTFGSAESSPQGQSLPELLNQLYDGKTALHMASESGRPDVVRLLLQYGADPATRDSSGRTPYFLSKDRSVRDSFRRFMGDFPSAYDYPAAQIPSPLTEAMERGRKEKMAERKKAVKKAKKQREKERKAEQEVVESQHAQDRAVAGLSEREKRALAAERRMAQQLPSASTIQRAGVCSQCGHSLAGAVPFERLQFSYCSMACLKEHRSQLASH